MTNETDAPEGGAGVEAIAEAPQVEPVSEATAEQPTGAEQPGPADDAGEATEEAHQKRVPWFQKRIDEVTRQKYDAQREADYWRGVAEGRTPANPQPEQQVGPPDRWEDPEGYDQWLINQATQKFAEEQQRQTALRTFEEREARARQTYPDFDSVVRDPTLPITPTMAEVIRESDLGPEVAYHLGTNRQEAQRIAGLPPHRQAVELGRIEALLSKPPAPQIKPIPPAPPATVGAISAGLSKSPEEMSYAEFKAWREAEEKTRN